jgi:hypothetical protein
MFFLPPAPSSDVLPSNSIRHLISGFAYMDGNWVSLLQDWLCCQFIQSMHVCTCHLSLAPSDLWFLFIVITNDLVDEAM